MPSSFELEANEPRPALFRTPFYYGWVNLTVAALAMVGTLPGRTIGLGLITEPLLQDLGLERVLFAQINLWGTLVGSLFCLGVGRLTDRVGGRVMLTTVAGALGFIVLLMSGVRGALSLIALITLTRGFGQSALSVVSITIVGQWFRKRLRPAMAVYSVILSIGFMIAFVVVGEAIKSAGWRPAWAGVGAAILIGLVPLGWLLVRRSPESIGLAIEGAKIVDEDPAFSGEAYTLGQALATPAFWVFALGGAVYGLIASGIALFNESILAEMGFDAATYHRSLAVTAMTGLAGNFLGGWLASKTSLGSLMALSMGLLTLSLLALPHLQTQSQVALYASVMGLAGGFVTVLFFSFWSQCYGRKHLAKIQGAAQMLTVLASAIGPLLLAESVTRTGSYGVMFRVLAVVVALLALAAWLTPLPDRRAPLRP
jgi:MFS family permease